MEMSKLINLIQCDDGCLRRFEKLFKAMESCLEEKSVYIHWKEGGARFWAIPFYVYPPLAIAQKLPPIDFSQAIKNPRLVGFLIFVWKANYQSNKQQTYAGAGRLMNEL